MEKLYKFNWDCGRMGEVEGIFIASEKEIKEKIGEEVYFGEILGKHSDVFGVLDKKDLQEIKLSENTLKEIKEVLGTTISGYNPLEFIE